MEVWCTKGLGGDIMVEIGCEGLLTWNAAVAMLWWCGLLWWYCCCWWCSWVVTWWGICCCSCMSRSSHVTCVASLRVEASPTPTWKTKIPHPIDKNSLLYSYKSIFMFLFISLSFSFFSLSLFVLFQLAHCFSFPYILFSWAMTDKTRRLGRVRV